MILDLISKYSSIVSDYKRKYSFHWQNIDNSCIYRWDNVPHHERIKTFPFHKHVGVSEAIEDSEVMNLEKILLLISDRLDQQA